MLASMAAVLLSLCVVSTSALATVPHATEGSEAMSYHAESFTDEVALRDALFWDGMDFENPFMFMNLRHSEKAPEASIEVFGLQDTGTNLLTSMLLSNFGQRLRYFDWSYFKNATGNFRNGLWKHVNLQMKFEAEPEDVNILTAQNVTALIMVRDPLSWLQSMRKAPYELGYCVMWSDFAESKWLNRMCQHPHPAGFRSTVNKTNFANLEQMWNNWTHAHLNADQYGFKNFVIIRYEDLIRDPASQLDRISSTLGIRQTEPWQVRSASAKTHGSSLGRMAALQKLSNKTYLGEYFPNQTTTACRLLDPALLSANNYTDCTGILQAAGVSSIFEEQKQNPLVATNRTATAARNQTVPAANNQTVSAVKNQTAAVGENQTAPAATSQTLSADKNQTTSSEKRETLFSKAKHFLRHTGWRALRAP